MWDQIMETESRESVKAGWEATVPKLWAASYYENMPQK
jgi:hypothetical protein